MDAFIAKTHSLLRSGRIKYWNNLAAKHYLRRLNPNIRKII
jgi:uncharacterized protein with von Willebrand factor type A (vWA) domain